MDAVALVAAYVDAKRYDDAVAMVRKLQAAFGSVRDMHLLHGRALLALGNSRDAVDPLQNAMAMSPYTLDGYQALVEAYVARRFWSGVEKTAKAAAQALPDLPAAWLFLAQCQTTMGNGAGALDTAQRAARHWPKSSLVLQALAEAHLATGNPAGAVAACDASVASDPRNNAARRLRARAQLQAGDTDAALKAADDALRHATRGDMGETAREAARVRFYRGEYPQCLALLKLSEEYEPNRPDVAMLRAMVNLYGGDQEAAWRGFLAALDFDRGGTATAEALNVVYAAANEKPPVTVAMVMLATVWERTGKVMEARDQYRRYRMAEPKGFLVRYVEERLEATKTKGR
jgi:tetratricopeptide (TPR) repeat protein